MRPNSYIHERLKQMHGSSDEIFALSLLKRSIKVGGLISHTPAFGGFTSGDQRTTSAAVRKLEYPHTWTNY